MSVQGLNGYEEMKPDSDNVYYASSLEPFPMSFMSKQTMAALVVSVVVCAPLKAHAGDQALTRIPVREKRLPNGNSVLQVLKADKTVAVEYPIAFVPHHRPATSKAGKAIGNWLKWKLGAFLCFNSNQFSGREFCLTKNPKIYAPPRLDVEQWISTFKEADMTHAVLTVRHTSGFLLWDSATSDFDVAASGNKTDLVRIYADECRRQGLAPGIYYCLWGGKRCSVTGKREIPQARALILAQLHELATRYGKIPYFWIDMMNWAPANLSTQEIYDSLKNVNPESIVIFNQHIQDGSRIRYFPTDVMNGEMVPPPAAGHKPLRKVGDTTYYLPFEFEPCSQSRPGGFGGVYRNYAWFTYGKGRDFAPSRPFPAEFLYKHIRQARKRGAANVLLSCAPDHTGRLRDEDAAQLLKLSRMLKDPSLAPPKPLTLGCRASASGVWPKPLLAAALAFDDDPTTRWGGAPDSKSAWLAADLGKEKTFDRVLISEGWDRVRRFELQIKKGDSWQTFSRGTTIGREFSATFPAVTARHVRLNIPEAIDVPTIWEFQLFAPKGAAKEGP